MPDSCRFEGPQAPLSGRRIRAGFHCHTVNSDGGLSPEQTAERYHAKGFECLGITDHGLVTKVDSVPGSCFLTIAATENGGDPDLIAVGIQTPAPKELPLAQRATMLARQGGFTIAAHPTWSGVLPCTYLECADLMAMEIYNAYCDAAYANGYALELWDMVLGQGKKIWGVAGDDAHLNPKKRHFSDAGLGWVEIWVEDLAEEPVLDSLRRGAFFSTQGPSFTEILVEGRAIHLRCSPVEQIRWRTFGRVGHVEYSRGNSALTGSSLPDWFRPHTFVRIELVDHHGRRAWSNPIFVNEKAGQ